MCYRDKGFVRTNASAPTTFCTSQLDDATRLSQTLESFHFYIFVAVQIARSCLTQV